MGSNVAIDETGHRYGRLLVLGPAERKNNRPAWKARCDCGNFKTVEGCQLRRGHVRSCGCLGKESLVKHRERRTANATKKSAHPLYRTWKEMIRRCHDPKFSMYKDYGARGIRVCDRWRESVDNFIADMGAKPSKKHSIDRIDNSAGYSPDNCRWATASQQNRNKRGNVMLTFNGETLTIADWSERTGVWHGLIRDRIRRGWTAEKALTAPPLRHGKRSALIARGMMQELSDATSTPVDR